MAIPLEMIPTHSIRVMDLVRGAGVDVSDWSNYKGGAAREAANPKYCYEWAFVQPDRVVALNLWLQDMVEPEEGGVEYMLNLMKPRGDIVGVRATRRRRMLDAIRTAQERRLPIRVIVLTRPPTTRVKGRKVELRKLDPTSWAVVSFDASTGDVVLRRGAAAAPFADQFSLPDAGTDTPARKPISGSALQRDRVVREQVLLRAFGRCEYCGSPGFKLPSGAIFLETHHVVPLAKGGTDRTSNVVAICPNDHREAHYGSRATEMRDELLAFLASLPEAPKLAA